MNVCQAAVEKTTSSLSPRHVGAARRFRQNFERAATLREQAELFNAYIPILVRHSQWLISFPVASSLNDSPSRVLSDCRSTSGNVALGG